MGSIVVGYDESDPSERALERAAELARLYEAPLVVTSVIPVLPQSGRRELERMSTRPGTWHHGLVADWWAEFNQGGPEIDYFGQFVAAGQPALDAGCGTGRLLLPWLRAGYDVDGCDVSADMIDRCRDLAEREAVSPHLWVQALHELAPPRR